MKISYSQLNDAAYAGGDLIFDIAKGAKGAVCGAYRNYKDWYYQNINLNSPPGSLLEGFWDNICPLESPYLPPSNPPGTDFTGGQCDQALYRITYEFFNGGSQLIRDSQNYYGKIYGVGFDYTNDGNTTYWIDCHGYYYYGYQSERIKERITNFFGIQGRAYIKIISIQRIDGLPDNCGNPPSNLPAPIAPPNQIDDIIPIDRDGELIDIPIKINPQIQLPAVNINVFAPIFKPELILNPQFDIKPEFNLNPNINFNFSMDGVDVSFGNEGEINNNTNNTVNNIEDIVNNISNTTNTTNNKINEINDKLACEPCLKLEEILEILKYKPVYSSASILNFESIQRDNLFNLGYLEIDIIKLPTSTKIIFGGNSDNAMYTGWLFWRMNGYNFEKVQISSEKSIYWAPKWANGFGITCTHNSKANCYYYIENKD